MSQSDDTQVQFNAATSRQRLAELAQLRAAEKQQFDRLMAEQETRLRIELQMQRQQTELEKRELCDLIHQRETELKRLRGAKDHAASTQSKSSAYHAYSTPVSMAPDLQQSLSPVNANASISQLLELTRLQYQQHADSMRLPPTDIIKFDGEPLQYWPFMRLFSTVVDKGTVAVEEKMTRLHQYTTGRAREAIAHCLYNPDPSVGYTDAMAILRKRFGSPYTISQAWVEKVLNYKDIKDNQQLQCFADTLRSCHDTLKAMDCESELNGGRALRRIVEKLPVDLKKRWLTQNYDITESGRLPKLLDIVKLVETEAAKRADPIFGNLVSQSTAANYSSPPNKSTKGNNKKKQSFATETTEAKLATAAATESKSRTESKPSTEVKSTSPAKAKAAPIRKCPKCAENHFLNQCSGFRALTVQERLTFVRQKKLCQNCFAKGHFGADCGRTWVCRVSGCGLKHNSWLHSAIVTTSNTNNDDNNNAQPATNYQESDSSPVQALATGVKWNKIALPILPVVVSDPNSNFAMNTYALLDNGSNGTFCSKTLVHALKLKTAKVQLKLNTIESTNVNVVTEQVALQVEDPDRENTYLLEGVLCRDQLHISPNNHISPEEAVKWPHLSDIVDKLPGTDVVKNNQVHLLIGLDQPDVLVPRELRRGEPGDPYAVLSGLGWTLNGPISDGPPDVIAANCVQATNGITEKMEQLVEKFWKLEDPGHMNEVGLSATDQQVVKLWKQETMKDGDHYVMPIPFKERPPQLNNNYAMAKHRLDSLGRRLKKDPALRQMYTAGVHDLLHKEYAEEVTDVNVDNEGSTWYLPHHPVFHPKKPGKVRIVFDCAAQHQGASLNDQIRQGPDLTNKLLGVLLKFRQQPVAINADIREMFCQVRVPPQDRDALRFLWWTDDDPEKPPKQYRMATHLFGGVWCPSAASFALQRTAEDNQEDFSDEAINAVMHNFYVDDCLKSVETEEAAISLATELCQLLERGGFKLTKWLSNSKAVMGSIPKDEWAKSLHELDLNHEDLPYERTLGVLWNVEDDAFTFDAKAANKPATKRGLLSTTSSVYDPLGFASPFILKAKALFQELCRRKIDWDQPIPDDIAVQWSRWLADLPLLSTMNIPRCLKPTHADPSTEVELHHFSDASELGYGAVTYIRMNKESRLVMAKAKLAPIKPTSIPRLELLAAVVATELDQLIKNQMEIPINKTFFWTDSTIVLQYINNDDRRFQTFVSNRVAKIHERSDPSQWRHVDTASNPADDVSRGLTAGELLSSERWLLGPTFLKLNQEDWPTQLDLGELPDNAEVKQPKQVYAADINTDLNAVDRLLQQYSEWHRLKRAIVLILRLKALLRKKPSHRLTDPITVEEMQEAETAVINYAQTTSFGSKITKSSPPAKLKPFKDKGTGVLRVGGRLINAPIPYDAKHPIILPGNHHVTDIIIKHYHSRVGHGGQERVLAELRQRFWILKGRATISRVLHSCLKCQRQKAKPQVQQMADLPESRVYPGEPAFTRTGVDYFGPFIVRRGRSDYKRYGCLFTCLTTRAIHLEVSHSLDTTSFINALQRFISRRGQPTEIRSDNGTNFVGAQRELRKAIAEWNQAKICDYLLQRNVKWIFNPPAASHMGGVWERQIRSVRAVLNSVLTQQTLDDEGLQTLFCIVEAIVNGRPLTKLSDDPSDPLPLTPNHLLLLRQGPTLPPGLFVKQDIYRRRWRQVQYLADIFWSRWLKEYLPALQERQKWLQPVRNLQVGDLVLVLQDNMPRNSWPLALVTETYPGADGLVRTVQVKTQSGVYTRPVDKTCLLEANLV